jgi:uncharacterized membrane protein HdeD (DUF308 family)
MKPQTLETLAWVLIYSGLLVLCLGLFLQRDGGTVLGWTLVVAGALDAAAGVVLIWRRSRLKP